MQLLVNIDVGDVTAATQFYCRALGLTVGRRFGAGAVELLGGSSPIYLLEKPPGSVATSTPGTQRQYTRHWTPVHLDFVVPQIEPAVARAQRAGACLEGEIRTQEWGRIAVLSDPFGHGFCLIEFRGRGYDEIAS